MTGEDALRVTENILRQVVEDVLQQEYGSSWLDHIGVTKDRLDGWHLRREEERKRRVGAVIDERILRYSDFTDLFPIIKKNWELFKPCFGDLKRLEVYLERLSILRNPGAHARQLLPFELALTDGMTGELRQQVTLFRAGGGSGPEPEYFPRIEEVHDSFGHLVTGFGSGKGKFGNTGLTLRPGDVVEFDGSAWDPEGIPYRWRVALNRGRTLYDGDGSSLRAVWDVRPEDIANQVIVAIGLWGDRSYHRRQDGSDDQVHFTYRVLPPRPEA